jgi:hypothetical protein
MNPTLPLCLAAVLLAACAPGPRPTDASEANFTQALQAYLARRGDLCVGRGTWPVDVTREEVARVSRNSTQLPVLERLGMVSSSVVQVETGDEGGRHFAEARRYQLTDAGRKFYLERAPYKRDPGHAVADHDFCVARLSLKRVVRWDAPKSQAVGAETVVTYTYDVTPAAWIADPEARRVFPMVDHVLRGAGTLELKEAMVLTPEGWEAKDL